MGKKKRVLLKLTGKVLSKACKLSSEEAKKIAKQIKELQKEYYFAIVIGGGNIMRGEQQGKDLGISLPVGHQAGMLATVINGIMLQDIFEKQDLENTVLSSIVCPQICDTASQVHIEHALRKNKVIIFAGGTGVPFFTTDTNAVVKALQIGASEIWKGTGIDGVYDSDPHKDKNAKKIKKIKYSDAISEKLGILDTAALTLAQKHEITIRVFNVFEPNALITASQDPEFGSIIW